MDEIERYLDDVCRTLGGSHDLRQHIRDELRDHIGETIDALAAKGLSLEDAAHKAIEDFGKPEDMRRELQSVYGRQVTAFLIGRAIAWKEQNMKSGWKWSFAATGVLLMLIVGQVLCIYAPFVFIFPGIRWHFEALGEALPALTAASLRAGTLVLGREAIPAWALLVAVLVAWGIFEWRSTSENKALIRLACGIFASFLLTAVLCFVAFATVLGLAEAASLSFHADPRPYALKQLSQAQNAIGDLRKAVRTQDRDAAHHAESHFTSALWNLRSDRQTASLVATGRPGQVETLQAMMQTMEEQSRWVRLDRRQKDMDALTETWNRFCREINYDSPPVPAAGGQSDDASGGAMSTGP